MSDNDIRQRIIEIRTLLGAGGWNAVVDVFSERNIPIKTIDRTSGLIATEQLSVASSTDTGGWADCGTTMGTAVRPTHAS